MNAVYHFNKIRTISEKMCCCRMLQSQSYYMVGCFSMHCFAPVTTQIEE